MRNIQNLTLAPFAPFAAMPQMPPNMLQLAQAAQLQQPRRPQRMNLFNPAFTPPVLPSPMIAGLAPGAMYPNVGFPNLMAQPHCLHQQQPHCHHHEPENHCSHHRGRHGCSDAHGHSSHESIFNRGSRSRSRSRNRTRSRSHSRRRSRSRSSFSRSSHVEIINNNRVSNSLFSPSSSSVCIPLRDQSSYFLSSTVRISRSATINDIYRCILGSSHSHQDVLVYLTTGRPMSLQDFRSVDELMQNRYQVDYLVVA